MDKRQILELTNDFRNNIYVQPFNHNMTVVDFEQWGAGEYKIGFNIREKFGKFIHLYIPYASISNLEKAIVFTEFAEKQGVTIVSTLVGYVSYGRQERETTHEPELLAMTKIMLFQLKNVQVIEPHTEESMKHFETLSFIQAMNEQTSSDTYVIAPDLGAQSRNSSANVTSHIVANKKRYTTGVATEIVSDKMGLYYPYDPDTGIALAEEMVKDEPVNFVIYDDICDGGRTFINVAQLVKEQYPKCTITLCVAHAILPFGTEHLKDHIDKIVTLNTCFPVGTYEDGYIEVLNALDVFYK